MLNPLDFFTPSWPLGPTNDLCRSVVVRGNVFEFFRNEHSGGMAHGEGCFEMSTQGAWRVGRGGRYKGTPAGNIGAWGLSD